MKTIREWYETVENQDIRRSLIFNLHIGKAELEKPTLRAAVLSGFAWDDTPQGHKYWQKYWSSLTCKKN